MAVNQWLKWDLCIKEWYKLCWKKNVLVLCLHTWLEHFWTGSLVFGHPGMGSVSCPACLRWRPQWCLWELGSILTSGTCSRWYGPCAWTAILFCGCPVLGWNHWNLFVAGDIFKSWVNFGQFFFSYTLLTNQQSLENVKDDVPKYGLCNSHRQPRCIRVGKGLLSYLCPRWGSEHAGSILWSSPQKCLRTKTAFDIPE